MIRCSAVDKNEVNSGFCVDLVNSEMWIQTAVKLPHNLVFVRKQQVIRPGIFMQVVGEKTLTFWIGTAIKSQTTVCKW